MSGNFANNLIHNFIQNELLMQQLKLNVVVCATVTQLTTQKMS